MDKEYFEVLFEVTHRGNTVANSIREYKAGTPESVIQDDYDNFVSDVVNNIDSNWSYYG